MGFLAAFFFYSRVARPPCFSRINCWQLFLYRVISLDFLKVPWNLIAYHVPHILFSYLWSLLYQFPFSFIFATLLASTFLPSTFRLRISQHRKENHRSHLRCLNLLGSHRSCQGSLIARLCKSHGRCRYWHLYLFQNL